MSENTSLYFIAILPPEPLLSLINEIKQDIASRFHTAKALRVMPHITIKSPFPFPASHEEHLLYWFESLEFTSGPFDLQLKGFDAFKRPKTPVLYIKPGLSKALETVQTELMGQLVKAPSSILVSQNEYDFHPHITIGYRDLSYSAFKKAWAEFQFKIFEHSFTVYSLHLLKHVDKKWHSIAQKHLLPFTGNDTNR